jgi:hypothetical protein
MRYFLKIYANREQTNELNKILHTANSIFNGNLIQPVADIIRAILDTCDYKQRCGDLVNAVLF